MEIRLRSLLSLTLLVVTLLVYGTSFAEPVKLPQHQVDLSRALVKFKVKVLGLMNVTGWFHKVHGSIVDSVREDSPEFDITVAVESMDTRHSIRDRFLKGPAFFDADRFPTIRFSRVRLLNGNSIRKQLAGKLTLRGITQPVVFELTPNDQNPKPDKTRLGDYVAHTTIKRSDFGLDSFGVPVSDNVKIMVYVKASDM
jgi:polyisoprenoid-binding protein YceI